MHPVSRWNSSLIGPSGSRKITILLCSVQGSLSVSGLNAFHQLLSPDLEAPPSGSSGSIALVTSLLLRVAVTPRPVPFEGGAAGSPGCAIAWQKAFSTITRTQSLCPDTLQSTSHTVTLHPHNDPPSQRGDQNTHQTQTSPSSRSDLKHCILSNKKAIC